MKQPAAGGLTAGAPPEPVADGDLGPYRKKRDFKRTPEPAPSEISEARAGFSFVVQKHAARRLHYDFRLELNGVLKSWAVTKGPSFDPADKRLAVHVEDHPLEYGSFEGVIPKGQYGGGTVMVWDRGHWEPEGDPEKGYAKGKLSFHLSGERLKGRWTLARMGGRAAREEGYKNWLLIKSSDEWARPGEGDLLVAGRERAQRRKPADDGGDRPGRRPRLDQRRRGCSVGGVAAGGVGRASQAADLAFRSRLARDARAGVAGVRAARARDAGRQAANG